MAARHPSRPSCTTATLVARSDSTCKPCGQHCFRRAARDYKHPAQGNECISNYCPAHILLVELFYLEACICLVYSAAFNQSLQIDTPETFDVLVLPSLFHLLKRISRTKSHLAYNLHLLGTFQLLSVHASVIAQRGDDADYHVLLPLPFPLALRFLLSPPLRLSSLVKLSSPSLVIQCPNITFHRCFSIF